MANNFVMRVLLWSITTGILLILAIMVGITCLLIHYNQAGFKHYHETQGRGRRDRGRGNGSRTVDDVYMDPRTDVVRASHPHMPGKRPPTPSDGRLSPSASITEHIYDMPTRFEVTASYQSRSGSSSSASSPPLKQKCEDSESSSSSVSNVYDR